jgi:hypothetical protein
MACVCFSSLLLIQIIQRFNARLDRGEEVREKGLLIDRNGEYDADT